MRVSSCIISNTVVPGKVQPRAEAECLRGPCTGH